MATSKEDLAKAAVRKLKLKSMVGNFNNPTPSKTAPMRFKGRYAGPDKYKGVIADELKDKYKGTYFGKDKYKGANRLATSVKPEKLPFKKPKKKKTYPGWTDPSGVRHAGNEPGKMYAS